MNVLLVSQCDKRALVESRRILDQFAERRGDRTWQTPITEAGLDTLRKLLRKTARKNTAVACHWIRGRDHSELLWIVGDASRFNESGAVPTNTSERDVRRSKDENDWHTLEHIRLLATLASLLHDLGKATVAFQERLRRKRTERNRIRHEWTSLRLFQAFVGSDNDQHWLERLADPTRWQESDWHRAPSLRRDGMDVLAGDALRPFATLPPIAAAVGWLIMTHHRLPMAPATDEQGRQRALGARYSGTILPWLDNPLAHVAVGWNEVFDPTEGADAFLPYWSMAGELPIAEEKWRTEAAKVAKRLLERRADLAAPLDNPYVMHLARLALMLSDHHYSSLPASSPDRVAGGGRTKIYANTDNSGRLKQPLDEHLLGVARGAKQVVRAFPGFERHLPRLARHRGLRKRTSSARYAWQNKAADTAAAIRESARLRGAFVVNMASTGCGKTLANARLVDALSDPRLGMRATYALGLRTLTLQTGQSYKQLLHLDDDDLAVLVGGQGSRELFEYYQRKAEATGSASIQDLLDEDSHVRFEGPTADHPLLSRALADPSIRRLISAPMLVCTVDHLAPATESTRAGRQIAPMLRLMSSDLILDELDDYDLADMPALTRLVYWAGMLGTRVILSSATLPPALVEGMFLAYRAGRIHYARNRGDAPARAADQQEIPCLWVDEYGATTAACVDAESLRRHHAAFVTRRIERLRSAPTLRRGEIVPVEIARGSSEDATKREYARIILASSLRLHAAHAAVDPVSGKRVSVGLVRLANIEPLIGVAIALIQAGAPEDHFVHVCVYHARFPLAQRSAIEHMLDQAFDRRQEEGNAFFRLATIRDAIDRHDERNHIFMVIASPVCEVGRDWDADWAIAEPSSMRSLIQLAGRVQRHRARAVDTPNIHILDRNLRAVREQLRGINPPAPVFIRPGFERKDDRVSEQQQGSITNLGPFRVRYARVSRLLAPSDYEVLSAIPRIRPQEEAAWQPHERLVDLEQARITAALLPRERWPASIAPSSQPSMARDEAAWSWSIPKAALTGLLPQQQRFRDDTQPRVTLAAIPDDQDQIVWHRVEDGPDRDAAYVSDDLCVSRVATTAGPRIGRWGAFDPQELIVAHAEAFGTDARESACIVGTVEVPRSDFGWFQNPWLGLWQQHQ